MQDLCCHRYHHWLQAKVIPEDIQQPVSILCRDLSEFHLSIRRWRAEGRLGAGDCRVFMDYLLRKVMAKPPEYTYWPPALRLFYRFLAEKGYLDDPTPVIAHLYAIEPDFIALVKKRS